MRIKHIHPALLSVSFLHSMDRCWFRIQPNQMQTHFSAHHHIGIQLCRIFFQCICDRLPQNNFDYHWKLSDFIYKETAKMLQQFPKPGNEVNDMKDCLWAKLCDWSNEEHLVLYISPTYPDWERGCIREKNLFFWIRRKYSNQCSTLHECPL